MILIASFGPDCEKPRMALNSLRQRRLRKLHKSLRRQRAEEMPAAHMPKAQQATSEWAHKNVMRKNAKNLDARQRATSTEAAVHLPTQKKGAPKINLRASAEVS